MGIGFEGFVGHFWQKTKSRGLSVGLQHIAVLIYSIFYKFNID